MIKSGKMKLTYENGTLTYLQGNPAAKNQQSPPVVFAKTNIDNAILHKEKNKLKLQFAETTRYIGGTIDGLLCDDSTFLGQVNYEDDDMQPLEGRYFSNGTSLVIKGRFVGRNNSHFILELNHNS
jgi:hypothetical protein